MPAHAGAHSSPDTPSGKSRRKPLTTRWSRDDWTAKALDLLMAEGVGAVKITRLCQELGVTKGSFYWHFADLDELMEAIATHWCTLTRESMQSTSEIDRLPPTRRLQQMTVRLLDDRSRAVERALRDWACTDPRVADAVAESDLFVFGTVQQALLDLGFTAAQARMRAGTLVYAGIGFAHGQSSLPKPTRAEIRQLLDLITDTSRR